MQFEYAFQYASASCPPNYVNYEHNQRRDELVFTGNIADELDYPGSIPYKHLSWSVLSNR
jgi:hypothetical protein